MAKKSSIEEEQAPRKLVKQYRRPPQARSKAIANDRP